MLHLTKHIINHIKKRPEDEQRPYCAAISGVTGIILNLLLCAAKFVIGALTGAVSITADAINNLSDATVNVVTVVGARLAKKPGDREHPFGHGRAEYISALIVSLSIFLMSFELAKSAIIKIIRPEGVRFSAVYVAVLVAAICVKLFMAYLNGRLFEVSDNLNLKAVMKDSLNDCFATLATIIALVLSGIFGIKRVDGIIGLAVAVFVFLSGVSVFRDIFGALIGEAPSKELSDRIEEIILDNELILGVHDLIVHNYGPGKIIASAHAEVPADVDLVTIHGVIDLAEKKILGELGIDICIHIDPVATFDSELEKYKTLTEIIVGDYNSDFTFHDFRIRESGNKKELSFDVVIPFEKDSNKEEIAEDLKRLYKEKLPEVELKINVEHSYTEQ